MNILVLNGSPKSKNSNTFQITTAFLDGLNSRQSNFVELADISKCDIGHCLGCYTCWTKTPGMCIIKDDMAGLIETYIHADLVIWSFPLYYYGMPSKIKAFLDRLLPTNLPTLCAYEDGTNDHPSRYDLSHQRYVLISTCGFYTIKGNYDSLFRQFEILFHDKLTKIICPEGELFRVPELSPRIDEYLSHIRKAGEEYWLQGGFSQHTQDKLEELLYPPDAFIEMANADWEIAQINRSEGADPAEIITLAEETNLAEETSHAEGISLADTPGQNAPRDTSYPFLRQMAALYNPNSYKKEIVLEMYFTDLNKRYQLLLGKEKCIVKTEDFMPFTTRIETPFPIWLDISKGKLSGSEAMMKRLYRVLGDLDTMLKMEDFFGLKKPAAATPAVLKPSNMLLLLLPFLTMWTLMPFHYTLGGAAGILASGLVAVLHVWFKPTPYERIGAFSVTLTGLAVILTGGAAWQLSIPYFVSGLLWLVSSFMKVPVTAYYSCKDYGGERACENPLFIRTNRILTVMWSIAYLLLGTAMLFAIPVANTPILEILIWTATGVLGLFTAWFSRWYPAWVAEGR